MKYAIYALLTSKAEEWALFDVEFTSGLSNKKRRKKAEEQMYFVRDVLIEQGYNPYAMRVTAYANDQDPPDRIPRETPTQAAAVAFEQKHSVYSDIRGLASYVYLELFGVLEASEELHTIRSAISKWNAMNGAQRTRALRIEREDDNDAASQPVRISDTATERGGANDAP